MDFAHLFFTRLAVLVLIICASNGLIAQEEEYYKNPSNRVRNHEKQVLPHLESKFSTFYFTVGAGFRKQEFNVVGSMDGLAENSHPVKGIYDITAGLNLNNKHFIEGGASNSGSYLSTIIYGSSYNPPFSFVNSFSYWSLPLRYKRRVLTIDRISRNAQINMGAGLGVLLTTKSDLPASVSENLVGANGHPYFSRFNVTLERKPSPIYAEITTELKGSITERLEVLVFFSGFFRKNAQMFNALDIGYTNGMAPSVFRVEEKPFSWAFGLQLRFNSKKFYRYNSII